MIIPRKNATFLKKLAVLGMIHDLALDNLGQGNKYHVSHIQLHFPWIQILDSGQKIKCFSDGARTRVKKNVLFIYFGIIWIYNLI